MCLKVNFYMKFQCFVNSTNINYWYLYGIILIGKLEAFLRKFTLIFKIFFLYNEIRDRSLIVWRHDWICWYYQVLDIYSSYVWKKIKWMNPPRPSIKPASSEQQNCDIVSIRKNRSSAWAQMQNKFNPMVVSREQGEERGFSDKFKIL